MIEKVQVLGVVKIPEAEHLCSCTAGTWTGCDLIIILWICLNLPWCLWKWGVIRSHNSPFRAHFQVTTMAIYHVWKCNGNVWKCQIHVFYWRMYSDALFVRVCQRYMYMTLHDITWCHALAYIHICKLSLLYACLAWCPDSCANHGRESDSRHQSFVLGQQSWFWVDKSRISITTCM